METKNAHKRRIRMGIAALGLTLAGLAASATPASAYQLNDYQIDREALENVDLSRIVKREPNPIVQPLEKTDVCFKQLNGTWQLVPAALCR